MRIEYYKEYSYNLNRDMEFKVFGHGGKPIITFPCQDKRFYDYEDNGLIESIKWYIEEGKIQVFCADSIDLDSWSATWKNPYERMQLQEAYYNYIINELVPRVYEISNNEVSPMAFGCSMGAFHAMNFFLRRPDIFDSVLALSGIYASSYFVHNYADELTFLNSPIDSLRLMDKSHRYIELYKQSKIIVCVGQGAWEHDCYEHTKALNKYMNDLEINAWFDYWGYDKPHDWSSWLEQAPYFLSYILD